MPGCKSESPGTHKPFTLLFSTVETGKPKCPVSHLLLKAASTVWPEMKAHTPGGPSFP